MAFLDWFTGGADHPYHSLYHCMAGDTLWVAITVVLDIAVASGYVVIAYHWWSNARHLPQSPARRALNKMRNIFILCGICGYVFIPIKMFWPAWRLYDFVVATLAFNTWTYAWGAQHLKVIYNELGKSGALSAALAKSEAESRQKSAFLNALSHDLRTPINGIMLQAEVVRLATQTGDSDCVHEAINDIDHCSRAASGLLDSLLECARLDWLQEPNSPAVFSLMELTRDCVQLIQHEAAAKGLSLQTIGSERLFVRTDRQKLERILTNLLQNAVKFTETGGIKAVIETAGDNIELQVIDSGIGFNAEQRERLFDEFYQARNHERDRSKGFGLGLTIARRLARQLGGDIAVASAPGSGSRFSIQLSNVRATEPAVSGEFLVVNA